MMKIKSFFILFIILTSHTYARLPPSETHGHTEGEVIETENAIVVNGMRVVQDGATQSAIRINNPQNKNIILHNIEVISNNGQYYHNDGMASIVGVRAHSARHIDVNNIRVRTHGITNIHADSYNPNINMTCAGITCIQSTGKGSGTRNIKIENFGDINTTAIRK